MADGDDDGDDDEGTIESQVVLTNDGHSLRDVLVVADDDDDVDEAVIVSRDDDEQEDGTCELMLTEEMGDDGKVRQVYVSDCNDLEAKQYKDEFSKVLEKTKVENQKYTRVKPGRSSWTLGGRSFRK